MSACLGVFPQTIDIIANSLNIGYPPILAVIFAISFILVKLLLVDIERSKQSRDVIRLNQRIGILEANLHESRKQIKQQIKQQVNNKTVEQVDA